MVNVLCDYRLVFWCRARATTGLQLCLNIGKKTERRPSLIMLNVPPPSLIVSARRCRYCVRETSGKAPIICRMSSRVLLVTRSIDHVQRRIRRYCSRADGIGDFGDSQSRTDRGVDRYTRVHTTYTDVHVIMCIRS